MAADVPAFFRPVPPPSSLLPSSALLLADALAALDDEETPNILRMAEAVARSVSEVLRRRDFFFCCVFRLLSSAESLTSAGPATAFTEFVDPVDEAVDSVDDVRDVAGRRCDAGGGGGAAAAAVAGEGTAAAAAAAAWPLLLPLKPTLAVGWCRTDAEVILHSSALAIR